MSERPGRGRRLGARPVVTCRVRPRALVATSVVAVLLAPSAVAAQDRSSDELEREVEEVEEERQQLTDELDGVREDLHEAEVELARIGAALEDARGQLVAAEGQVALAEEALEEAEQERDDAQAEHERSEELLATTERELAAEEMVFVDQVVETFKYGTAGATRGAMAIEILRRAEDPNAFAVGMKQLQIVVDDQDTTVQNVFELRELRSEQADDAARARSEASQAAAEAEDALRYVEQLREDAAEVAAEVERQEDNQRQVLASIEADEAETEALLERVAGRQADLEQELQEQRAREEEERRRAAEEAAAAAQAQTGGPGSGEGRLGLPGADGGPPVDGVVCPVAGAVAGRDFSNDWGYPRSGGRYHQGNDIFASRGTPVVAVGDGEVIRMNPPSSPTNLGGITLTYRTADGSEWYNAHLDTIADGLSVGSSVSRGEQIGTVGNTGNARTTPPHLHIGRRLGGSWVNPWPTIAGAC